MAEVYTHDRGPVACLGKWLILLADLLAVVYLTFSSEKTA
jgi:hypothetical protein